MDDIEDFGTSSQFIAVLLLIDSYHIAKYYQNSGSLLQVYGCRTILLLFQTPFSLQLPQCN